VTLIVFLFANPKNVRRSRSKIQIAKGNAIKTSGAKEDPVPRIIHPASAFNEELNGVNVTIMGRRTQRSATVTKGRSQDRARTKRSLSVTRTADAPRIVPPADWSGPDPNRT